MRLEARAVPAGFVVTSTANAGANTLRQAILDANANGTGLDTITFSLPANSTITLSTELAITGSLQIDGPSALDLTVSGNKVTRIFNVNNAGASLNVSMKNLRMANGNGSGGSGGAVLNTGEDLSITNCVLSANTVTGAVDGGAILINGGKLTLADSTLSANSATGFGGGVYFNGGASVTVTNCTLQGNSSANSGGAISNNGGSLTVTNSVVTGNFAAGDGGGIEAYGISFTLQSTTVSGNTAGGQGGGIRITNGTTTLLASTVSGNKATNGGGVYMSGSVGTMNVRNMTVANNVTTSNGAGIFVANVTGTVNLTNSTVTGNAAGGGSGGGFTMYGGSPTVNLESSIVSGNPSGGDMRRYFGTLNVTKSAFQDANSFTNLGGNIVGPHANLLLGALASNGGLVQTQRPQTGSPLINAGSNPGAVTTDARGVSRSIGVTDIGAVEFVPTSIVVTTTADSGAGSLRQALNDGNIDRNSGAATPVTITFDTAGAFSGNATINVTSGELAITDSTLVQGPDVAERLTVKSNGSSRVFNTSGGAANMPVTLQRMTITGGLAASGGGVQVGAESVTLFQVHVTGNSSNSGNGGGGINVSGAGKLTVQSSTVSKNINTAGSSGVGGGIRVASGSGSLTLLNATVSGNSGQNNGGGVYFAGSGALLVRNSTVANNSAFNTGGIFVPFAPASISIESSIISDNGGNQINQANNPTFNISNSAIGTPNSFKFGTNSGNLIGQALLLGPLQGNGGYGGPTHRPAATSPVIDAGSNPAAMGFDQTENFRTIGSAPDIGAVESRYTVVLNTNDAGAGSLRQAVQHGFSNDFNGTVTFDPVMNGTTITLSSEIAINDDVIVDGPGASLVTVHGNNANRIFSVSIGPTATIRDLTLTNGKSTVFGGAVYFASGSTLTITDCVISSSSAGTDGGGVGGFGKLTLNRTTLSGNTAGLDGGAVFSRGATITDSTLAGNTAMRRGGAILFNDPFTASFVIRNCTITGNAAPNAAAITLGYNASFAFSQTLTLQNSTIAGNTSGGGGAVQLTYGAGTVAVESTVISGNSSPNQVQSSAAVTGKNSAIGSTSGFALTDQGGNILNQPHANLKLGGLASNGGPTQTMLPLPGSPLVDAGSNPASLTTDQRGEQRTVGSKIDIGATEAVNLVVVNDLDSGSGSLRQTVLHANSAAGANTITFDLAAFAATDDTITLTTGEIAITDSVSITGPGALLATVSGNNASRIFSVNVPSVTGVVDIAGLTITNGMTADFGGGIFVAEDKLTLTDMAIVNNSTLAAGGGLAILSTADVTVRRSTFSGNSAEEGGGIALVGPGNKPFLLQNSTVTHNTSTAFGGGGINANTSSTSTFTIRNSTLTGNSAPSGGALYLANNGFTAAVESSIVSGNLAAGSSKDISSSKSINLNFSAVGVSSGFSFTGGNNLGFGANLKLGVLKNNGGQTQTLLPAADSPLVGKGSNPAALAYDQRGVGYGRERSGSPDIGAVEANTNFVVLNNNDAGTGSLRQAVLDANAFTGADTVTFEPTFFATARTITMAGTEMAINESVTITGPGSAKVTVDADAKSRVFNIASGLTATISGMTLTNASASGDGGAILGSSSNTLTLNAVTVTNSTATSNGGAVAAPGGSLVIADSIFTGNKSSFNGGALSIPSADGTMSIVRSTISGNTTNAGGGLYVRGSLNMADSTVSGNSTANATFGGGAMSMNITGSALIRNSTISGNSSAGQGGGIRLVTGAGLLTIQNSTITNNTASGGSGGGGVGRNSGTSTITMVSTIISGNAATVAGPDVFTTGTANLTDCLLGSASGINTFNPSGSTGVLLGKAPNLGPLADNGGPTQTHMLLSSSPAIGQGSNPAPALTTDQRGVTRVVGNIDIGAYEVQPAPTATVKIDSGTGQRSMIQSLTVTFSEPVYFTGSAASAITLQRLGTSSIPTPNGLVTLQFSPASGPASVFTITFNDPTFAPAVGFAKSLIDGQYQLLLDALQIRSAAKYEPLDGDANGVSGDNQSTNFHRLFGDVRGANSGDLNGNGFTDNVDLIAFRGANGSDSTMANYDPALDVNGDGFIDNLDFIAFRGRLGVTP